MASHNHVLELPTYVLVDFRTGGGPKEIADAYRYFAAVCTKKNVRRAVVAAGVEESNAHYALRDAFTTMILANGIPRGFNLALIATTPRTRDVYRAIERDFGILGIHAKLFEDENEALSWLENPRARP